MTGDLVEVLLRCLGLGHCANQLSGAGFSGREGLRTLIQMVEMDPSSLKEVTPEPPWLPATRMALQQWARRSLLRAGGVEHLGNLVSCGAEEMLYTALHRLFERSKSSVKFDPKDMEFNEMERVKIHFRLRIRHDWPVEPGARETLHAAGGCARCVPVRRVPGLPAGGRDLF